jgi:hypothetical protein
MYGDTEEYHLFDPQYIDGYYMYKGYRAWTRERCQHGIWGGGAWLPGAPMQFSSMWVVRKHGIVRSRFLLSGDLDKRKYHFVNLKHNYKPKDSRGLGILELYILNIGLLSKSSLL